MDLKILNEMHERRAAALAGGGELAYKKRYDKGLMSARDRINNLVDNHSFQENGLHVKHHCRDFEMDKKEAPGDGVITGLGTINGRSIGVYSQDFTVIGGSLGRMHAQKITTIAQKCIDLGIPFIGINDSGGARIQEAVESLTGYAEIFAANTKASGVVPQICVIAGPCAGGAAYSPALCDFVIMVKNSSYMFITGPEVIKTVTFQDVTMQDIGDANVHASISGNAHFVAENDEDALNLVKHLLSFLPSNNLMDPPHDLNKLEHIVANSELENLMPNSSSEPYNVKDILVHIVDNADFLEVHEHFAKNIVIGLGRIGGIVCGIIANQPCVKAGCLDIDASDKSARFINFCNAFNIPLVTFVDTPGFLPGINQERNGIIRHGAKMLHAYAAATVPKITIILRKAYGGAYIAMCPSSLGADAVYLWPTAEIAVMGAEQAVRILYRKELDGSANAKQKQTELASLYRERFSSPYQAAALGLITDVINPADTKQVIVNALKVHLSKKVSLPPKKLGNIPL